MLNSYDRVLIVGCGTCVAVCHTGGERAVNLLGTTLRLARKVEGRDIEIGEQTVIRQCDFEYLDQVQNVDKYQVILSLACGVGIQGMARKFPNIPVLPGVNTTFMGFNEEYGYYTEMCKGCGECILDVTGGICPIARCAKSLLNGPCGGTNNGKCEIDLTRDCGWILIYDKMNNMGQRDKFMKINGPKNHRKANNLRYMDLRNWI
ncbi:methylenetetrahydrofolate reductase C-terminal domain-containing protein [Sporomusa carbonis]|uniref:methylenetetrahydrofolate reductase C-terminal domain-containing protein n=1 Tax=Sporomusa carbonis TaxID=3076075 RepID=UPI003C7A0AEF